MSELNSSTIAVRSDAKEFICEYWSKRSEAFSELRKKELSSDISNRWRKELLGQLPEQRGLKILDVGCGAGFFSILLAEEGHLLTGVDLTKEMIVRAKMLAAKRQLDINFQAMDAEQLAFPDETFDVIVSRNLTWNLPNPEQAYKEWLRVLKPGGILLNYDGEHAKDHHQNDTGIDAHQDLTDEQKEQCHRIYHMLEIGTKSRPQWDIEILNRLGVASCEVGDHINRDIYRERDAFYIPTELFAIRVKKMPAVE